MNADEYLDVIADYADRLAGTEDAANKDTMTVAHAIDDLYESRVWVAEWLEQKPRPKNGGSNRWKEDSRNRFSEWQAWKQQQRGRRPLEGRYVYRLHDATVIEKRIPNLALGQIRSERTLRPFKWLLTNRYEDRIPEAWAEAVSLAGDDPIRVTSRHTREGRDQWKRKVFGTRRDGTPRRTSSAINQAADAAGKAHRLRVQILSEMREMVRYAGLNEKAHDEWRDLLDDIDALLDENEAAVAAAVA